MLNTLAIEEYNELRCKGEVKIIMRCTTQGREKCKINTHAIGEGITPPLRGRSANSNALEVNTTEMNPHLIGLPHRPYRQTVRARAGLG